MLASIKPPQLLTFSWAGIDNNVKCREMGWACLEILTRIGYINCLPCPHLCAHGHGRQAFAILHLEHIATQGVHLLQADVHNLMAPARQWVHIRTKGCGSSVWNAQPCCLLITSSGHVSTEGCGLPREGGVTALLPVQCVKALAHMQHTLNVLA